MAQSWDTSWPGIVVSKLSIIITQIDDLTATNLGSDCSSMRIEIGLPHSEEWLLARDFGPGI